MYSYKAKVLKVIDGDTIDAKISNEVDFGFDLRFTMMAKRRFRLYGINAPESRTRNKKEKKRGLAAKKRLNELIGAKEVVIKSHKQGKFKRYLAEIFLDDGTCVNNLLVKEGHAVAYFGGKR